MELSVLCLVFYFYHLTVAEEELLISTVVSMPDNCLGRKSQLNDVINVHYVGRLLDGTTFDSR